jgi:hypothetical protein
MPTTTNFGWTTPADTDLVKDGAAAIRTLGNGIDTSLLDLKGGLTDQVLAKNSNTDLDFKWVTQDDADAIQKSLIDAEGDLIVGDAADAVQRLAIGSNGNILTVDTSVDGKIKWAAPAVSGKVLQVVQSTTTTATTVTGTTFADTGLSGTITPTANTSKILVMVTQSFNSYKSGGNYGGAKILRGATTIYDGDSSGKAQFIGNTNDRLIITTSLLYLDSPATTSATTYKTQVASETATGTITCQSSGSIPGIIILMEIGA